MGVCVSVWARARVGVCACACVRAFARVRVCLCVETCSVCARKCIFRNNTFVYFGKVNLSLGKHT